MSSRRYEIYELLINLRISCFCRVTCYHDGSFKNHSRRNASCSTKTSKNCSRKTCGTWPTLRNLAANDGRIAISVYDAKTLGGYQIRGTAEHVADGPVVATFKAMVEQMFQGAATAKGALIITPETVIVTTPGAENKKVL